ncbi:hypothetical protein LJC00_03125 [Dysgonomonas sp. OttesenSCG-928-M03]|nr:hypothetical protein [Dysgonomonas sp. OttesenSCG-928-M03]
MSRYSTQDNIPRLKRQNLLAAKILSVLLYPTMIFFSLPIITTMGLHKESELVYRLLYIAPALSSIAIVYGVLHHMKKYLSNFSMDEDLHTLFERAITCMFMVMTSLVAIATLPDADSALYFKVGGSIIFLIGIFLLFAISTKIPTIRNPFVDGVEDFSRLHSLRDNTTHNVIESIIPLYTIYAAFATPAYIYRMFSKAKRYADKYGFEGGSY